MFRAILVQPLFNLLVLFYALIPGNDFGLAVIALTILVRLILWPVVNKQLHSQKAMQELAPEVARVRKEAGGDKQKESQMLMELYKEKEINPFSSLVPLIIQLPLFIALFIVLRDIVEPGKIAELTYGFLSGFPAVSDILAAPESFRPTLFGIVNLAQNHNIPLSALAGLAQFVQSKQLAPKHPDSAQKSMFATMSFMFPVLTAGIAYTLPAALALYWAVTSLVAIGQQHLVLKQDVEDLEEAADKRAAKKPKKTKKAEK